MSTANRDDKRNSMMLVFVMKIMNNNHAIKKLIVGRIFPGDLPGRRLPTRL